jgi:hypothetical protein
VARELDFCEFVRRPGLLVSYAEYSCVGITTQRVDAPKSVVVDFIYPLFMAYRILLLVAASFLACWGQLSAQSVQVKASPAIVQLESRFVAVNRAQQTVPGWRLQLIATPDRNELERIRMRFISLYPNYPADWVHNKPYYQLRVGAFTSKLDALRMKHLLEADFDGIYLVRDEAINRRDLLQTF